MAHLSTGNYPKTQNLSQADVLVEDNPLDPKIFYLKNLKEIYTYGKHTVLFDTFNQKTEEGFYLKDGSEILCEVLDSSGKSIPITLIPSDSISGAGAGYITIPELRLTIVTFECLIFGFNNHARNAFKLLPFSRTVLVYP